MNSRPGARPPQGGRAHSAGARGAWVGRLMQQLPYVSVLLVAAYLFYRASQFATATPDGRIGPDVWPKAILGLAMLTCCYAIVKNLLFRWLEEPDELQEPSSKVQEAAEPGAASEPATGTSARRLVLGMGLILAYAGVVSTLGFFLCTVLFLAGFTWLGGYRRPGVVAATSLIGGLVFTYVFMKIVYVSLPLGTGPFERLSVHLLALLGIR